MPEETEKMLWARLDRLESKLDDLEKKFYISLANLGGITLLVISWVVERVF